MPIYNEAVNIAAVVEEWFACLERVAPNFILFALNDGSKDETSTVLDQLACKFGPRLRVVHKTNSGHGHSCRKGYELALAEQATWILQIDSDGQCDPAFFRNLYSWRRNRDCVFGYRRTRDDGLGRVLISASCRVVLWLVTGTNLLDPNVPYRLVQATVLRRALRKIPADFDLQNIALSLVLARDASLRWKHCPIHFRARQGGTNSINYRKIAALGLRFLSNLYRLEHDENSHPGWWPRWTRRRLAS